MQTEDERIAALLKMAGPRTAVPPDAMLRVRAAAHDAWSDAVGRSNSRRRMIWTAAAAAVVFVIALQLSKERPAPSRTVAARTVISAPSNRTLTLQWRQHGSLRLAPSTVVQFETADAITLQRGAIYFSSDAGSKPVAVRTRFGIVRDIGTQFEARLDSDALRVRVREGRIELNGNDAEAGTEITAAADGVKKRSIPIAGADWNWVLAAAPPMTLEGNAREVLTAIAREKGLKLIFSDRALADSVSRMSLHSRVPLTPDEALDAATTASNLTYRVSGDTLAIERRRTR